MLPKPRADTHVHFRGENLSYKSKIEETIELLRKNGITVAVDKPNNDPPTVSLDNVETRTRLAELAGYSGYYLDVGLTNNPEQIKKAAEIATKHPRVVGLKYFTTGKKDDVLAITKEEDQLRIYETLAKCKYRGVISIHCEKESLFNRGAFNSKEPTTWNDERPPVVEEQAAKDQIKFGIESDFQGHIRFLHMSSPSTFYILKKYSKMPQFEVSGEITPNHLLLTTEDMKGEEGLDFKTNPPIRKPEIVDELWKKLKEFASVENKFTPVLITIGSDHAPHTQQEKRNPPYASGYPGLKFNMYSKLIEEMRRRGFTEDEIDNLTYWNVKKIFPKIQE